MISGKTTFSAGNYGPSAQGPDGINHKTGHITSTDVTVEQIRNEANTILRTLKSHLRLMEMVRRKDLAIQFKTATYTHVIVILGSDKAIIGIVQVVDIHRPFKWMTNGLPGPNTRKIYFHKDLDNKGWDL